MLQRVIKAIDLSRKDFTVDSGILRIKSGAFFFDASTTNFNQASPLSGWTPPSVKSEGAIAIVVFKKGVAYYKNIAGTWTFQKYHTDYFVPTVIGPDETYIVPENTQVLYHEPIDVQGELIIEGELIFVGGGSEGAENCWWANLYYDYSGSGNIIMFEEGNTPGDIITWQFFDIVWTDVQVGGTSYAWPEGPGFYRVKQERVGFCDRYSNVVEAYNL